jgi:large subunit ribosomal protein L24
MAGKGATKKPGARSSGMKIKKGDHVIVIAGRDNGREGTVIAAYPDKQQVLVQGVNMIKKNKKVDYQSRGGLREAKEGGIIHQEALIHVSNVQLVDPDTKKPARAGYRRDDGDKKVRVSRSSGKDI